MKHGLLGAAICALAWVLPVMVMPPMLAIVYFWAKEAGEKSKQWDAPGRPWSDWNPFGARWSMDDRMDLLSGVVGALLAAVAVVLVGWL